ncbi:hypothetical protein BH11PLA2_BH11PLA2_09370 [soil metagenome]
MKTYQMTLPDDFAGWVDGQLANQNGADRDTFFLAAIVALKEQIELDLPLTEDELRDELAPALEQLDRGEGVDGPTVMARLHSRLSAARLAKLSA